MTKITCSPKLKILTLYKISLATLIADASITKMSHFTKFQLKSYYSSGGGEVTFNMAALRKLFGRHAKGNRTERKRID